MQCLLSNIEDSIEVKEMKAVWFANLEGRSRRIICPMEEDCCFTDCFLPFRSFDRFEWRGGGGMFCSFIGLVLIPNLFFFFFWLTSFFKIDQSEDYNHGKFVITINYLIDNSFNDYYSFYRLKTQLLFKRENFNFVIFLYSPFKNLAYNNLPIINYYNDINEQVEKN